MNRKKFLRTRAGHVEIFYNQSQAIYVYPQQNKDFILIIKKEVTRCEMVSSGFTRRAQNGDKKSWITNKWLTLPQSKKGSFPVPLYFEKRDYSLVGPLHNPDCIKSKNCIFSKNSMLCSSKIFKCDC